MLTKKDIEALSEARLADAKHLLQAKRYSAAYYLSGYAVELGIKACVASVFQANAIPDKSFVDAVYSHRLRKLIGLAGLEQQLERDMKADPDLAGAWGVASKWTEASRYAMWTEFASASMVQAVGDPEHGVVQWLKKHW